MCMADLDCHEFSGTLTFETSLGLETVDFAYSLILAPKADEAIIETAARAIAQFIVTEELENHTTTKYHPN